MKQNKDITDAPDYYYKIKDRAKKQERLSAFLKLERLNLEIFKTKDSKSEMPWIKISKEEPIKAKKLSLLKKNNK